MGIMLLSNRMILKMRITPSKTMNKMSKGTKKREKEDLKKTLMRETIFVDVEKATCLMLLSIHMLRPSIKAFFLKELPIFRKKESRVRVLIAGKSIVATAIYLRLMSSIKDLKSLLT